MKRNLFLSLLIVFFTVSFMSLVRCSDDIKVNYRLQEQCGEDSERFFKKNYNETFSGFYTNHYNQKLNKCFILVDNTNLHWRSLYDVNESKLHGLFTPDGVSCFVYEKKCEPKSEKKFDSLVKPYMEE